MKRKKILALLPISLILFIMFTGCGKPGGQSNPGNGPGYQGEKPVPVIVEQVTKRDLQEYITITGKLEGITDITLSSQTSGKVIEIYKHLGDWVKKGEEIGRIDNSYYRIKVEQARAYLLSAEAAYESVSIQMDAAESLYSEGRISQTEYSTTKSNFKKAQAALDDAKANVELAEKNYEYSRFVAPVSGYITALNIEIGEMVTQGSPICSIVNSKRLVIKTGISESDITKIEKGQSVEIFYPPTSKKYSGEITGLGIKPINGTANYPIEIELDNPGGELYPGMVIEAKIDSNLYKDVIFTSINNIRDDYDKHFLYVIDEEKRAKKVYVEYGVEVSESVIIKSGLEPGDLLVIEGIDSLNDGRKVEVRTGF